MAVQHRIGVAVTVNGTGGDRGAGTAGDAHPGVPTAGSATAAHQYALSAVDRAEFTTGPPLPPQAATLARILRLLGPQPGDRVLEVGTGSGYTAAVLSEIVGRHGDVVTIEADIGIASQARERLIDSGRESRYGTGLINVTVLRREPFDLPEPAQLWDRVLFSTDVPLGRLPYAAVAGTRPGGVVIARVSTEFAAGPLVRFDVGSDGIARGKADAASVECGADPPHGAARTAASGTTRPGPTASGVTAADITDTDISHTTIDVANLLRHPAWRCAVAVAVPSCRYQGVASEDVSGTTRPGLLLSDLVTSSWAHVEQCESSDHFTVRQSGPRRLADEVFAAVRWYADRGAPPLDTWTWEVGPDRQCVTINE